MKKIYKQPFIRSHALSPRGSLLALSVGKTSDVGVYTGESHDAGEALVKENPFDYEWK